MGDFEIKEISWRRSLGKGPNRSARDQAAFCLSHPTQDDRCGQLSVRGSSAQTGSMKLREAAN